MILQQNIQNNKSLNVFKNELGFFITDLKIQRFRNHNDVNLSLRKKSIVLHGFNGAGKTNILEAISLLNPGRGLRKAKSKDIIPNITEDVQYELWGVNASINTPNGNFNIGSGLNELGKNRIVKINSEKTNQRNLLEVVKISWITPQMLIMFHLSLSEKRRFLDRLVNYIDPTHVSNIYRYEKLSRERSKIINQQHNDDLWLETIEKKIIDLAFLILKKRYELVNALNKSSKDLLNSLKENYNFPLLNISVNGEIEAFFKKSGELDAKIMLTNILKNNRKKFITSFPGPHQSNFEIYDLTTKQEISICSTGEQKIMLISLVLSHSRLLDTVYEYPPILLLDDIAEHLDCKHKDSLFEETAKHKSQCWFTTTNKNVFKKYPLKYDDISISNSNNNLEFESEKVYG